MREAKEKLSLVERFVMYLWKIWFKDDAMKFHGLPAGLIDMRYLNFIFSIAKYYIQILCIALFIKNIC